MERATRTAAPAAACVLLALSLIGCGEGAPVAGSSTPNPSERPPFLTATPGPIVASGTPADVSPARLEAIRADLESRGVPVAPGALVSPSGPGPASTVVPGSSDGTEAPAVVSSEAVTWPNGALGCPQPGRSYTQSLVEGMRVIVSAGGTRWDYRFGAGDSPVLCSR